MSCPITISGIVTDCSTSLGGIKKVYITNFDDVQSVSIDETTNQISGITMSGSSVWYEYNFRKNTSSMDSTLNVDEGTGTNYVTTNVNLVFTKLETAKRIEIAALSIGHLAIVVVDSNGKYWYVGKDEYVSATAGTGNTGTAKGDQNGYTITLTGDSETYPYELSSAAITVVTGA